MLDFDYFLIALGLMSLIGWFLSHRTAINAYDSGFMDAVQLHSEDRLTYTVDDDLITIEITNETEPL